MKIYGSILEGIEGKLIEVESDINPELAKSIKILGARGIAVNAAAEKVLRVLPAVLPEGMEAKGLITVDLIPIPSEGGHRGDALALPIGIRAYLALLFQEMPDPPEPPKPGATDEKIREYNESLKNIKTLASARAKILKHIQEDTSEYLIIGGIHLDGRLHAPERGLMGLISCAKNGMKVIVPNECAGFAYLTKLMLDKQGKSINVRVASTFAEAVAMINGTFRGGGVKSSDLEKMEMFKLPYSDYHNFSEIVGQQRAKYALEIAAAGGHHVLLWGPTREGKSTLANAIIGILPSLFAKKKLYGTVSDLAEINKVYTAKGLLRPNQYVGHRPFRSVSAKTGAPGLIGGGRNPQPGEISLAHCGVLMIDEFNFMDRQTIEQLRVPLSEGYIDVVREKGSYRFPASFTLIATMNPCRCSCYGEYECPQCRKVVGDINGRCRDHPTAKPLHRCRCSQQDIRPYQNFSSPILERIDLIVQVFSVDPYSTETEPESSEEVKKRVDRAIKKQAVRYKDIPHIRCNAEVKHKDIVKNIINMDDSAKRAAKDIHQKYRLNTGSYVRLHAVARTIADLKDREIMTTEDIIEAHKIMGRDRDVFNKPAGRVDETLRRILQ